MPVASRGRDIGSVTTLRDRTELVSLQRELDVTRTTTESLRAQTHEFSNQLHTISGLIELEEYHEVVRYVSRLTRSQARPRWGVPRASIATTTKPWSAIHWSSRYLGAAPLTMVPVGPP